MTTVAPTTPTGPTLLENSEYRRWLVGDLLLTLGSAIGVFAFPLIDRKSVV